MAEPTEPQPIAWDRDVLALIPPTDEMLRLESLACLATETNPLMRLALWSPTDETDEFIRELLLGFGEGLLAVMWTHAKLRRPAMKAPPALDSDRIDLDLVDPLTGLYNAPFFWLRLEEEFRRHRRLAQPVAVVLLEPDWFEGERPLGDMADVLLRVTGGRHVLCRYAGRNFAIILINTSSAAAHEYVEIVRGGLASGEFTGGRRCTVNVGIAGLPDGAIATAQALVDRAVAALRAAKAPRA
jgi:diguanylate cyclase (GGDEF)-like protein